MISLTRRAWPPSSSAPAVRRVVAVFAVAAGVGDLVVTATRGSTMHLAGPSGRILHGVLGGRYALPAMAVTLIWISRGLLRGKHNAWIVAALAATVSILATHAHGANLVGVVPAAALLAAVLLGRDGFRARHDPARVRDAARLLVIGGIVVFVYGFVGLRLLDSQFASNVGMSTAAGEALRSMVLRGPDHLGATAHGRWLLESVRVGALVVVLTAAARLLLTYVMPTPVTERRTVDLLVEEWGDTALAPFQVSPDKSWFLCADRSGFVPYVLVRGVAVALGDPVGPPSCRAPAMVEFREWCELNGWIPVAYQLTEAGAAAARRARLNVVKIGEEAVIDLAGWRLECPKLKSVRSAVRRVSRAGFTVVELPTPIDDETMTQLRDVSDRWLMDGHRERTFTVERFDEDRLRDATILAVRHRDTGRIVGFVDVLDSYRSRVGNFDLMRRDPDSPNGVMDVLMVALIERFRAEQLSGMTLGLAPLVNIDGSRVSERTMRLIFDRGEALFNYQGLRQFKDKWSPQWHSRYLAYPNDAMLPRVALAVARAGELPDPTAWWSRLRRLPATLCLTAIIVWFMAATNGAPAVHHDLLRHVGLAWRDLQHLQLWRLPTSQLAETTPGFVWANVALLLFVLPIAEWRLGTRRTVLVFFLGDWVSTLITLVGLRLAAPWSPWASHILTVRDAGPSAGAWALAITVALTLHRQRLRRIISSTLFTFLTLALVFHGRLFDIQHLLSACAAAAGVWLWARYAERARCRHVAPRAGDSPRARTAAGAVVGAPVGVLDVPRCVSGGVPDELGGPPAPPPVERDDVVIN